MLDYQNGKIFQIVNDMTDDIYIGITTTTLKRALNECLHNNKNESNRKLRMFVQNVGRQHFVIELLEDYPCLAYFELRQRSEYYIQRLKPSLNMNHMKTVQDHQEYYLKKLEYVRQHRKFYQEKRKHIEKTGLILMRCYREIKLFEKKRQETEAMFAALFI